LSLSFQYGKRRLSHCRRVNKTTIMVAADAIMIAAGLAMLWTAATA
jgi:hypothetical protein